MTNKELLGETVSGKRPLSYTSLSEVLESPKHFFTYLRDGKKETEAMNFGKAFHKFVLEPATFQDEFCFSPDVDRRTKEGKLTYDNFIANKGDRSAISTKELSLIYEMNTSLISHPFFKMKDAWEFEKEVKFQYRGWDLRGFLDMVSDGVIVDLKVCPDASPRAFKQNFINRKMALQACIYSMAYNHSKEVYFLAVDRDANFTNHFIDNSMIELGLELLDKALDTVESFLDKPEYMDMGYEFYSTEKNGSYLLERPAYV